MTTTNANCYKPPFPPCETDVLSYANFAGFPANGELDKLYIDNATGKQYSWNGTAYVNDSDDTTIYDRDGTLTGNRTMAMAGNDLSFTNGDVRLTNGDLYVGGLQCGVGLESPCSAGPVAFNCTSKKIVPLEYTERQWSVAAGGNITKNAKNAPDYNAAGRDWFEYYNTKDIIPPCAAPAGYEWLADVQGSSYFFVDGFPATSGSVFAYELAMQDLIVGGGTHFGTKSLNRRRQQIQVGDDMTFHTEENMNLVNTFKLINGVNTITRNTRFSITDTTPVADRPSSVLLENRWKVKVYLSKITSL